MRKVFTIPALALLLCMGVLTAAARPKIYTLVEKTRGAQLIAFARVAELRPSSIVFKLEQQIKGAVSAASLEASWDYVGNLEQRPPKLEAGEQVLLFAVRDGDSYKTFGGSQGVVKLDPGDAQRYQSLIRDVLDFDAADSPILREQILSRLLEGAEPAGRLTALEIIYNEFQTNTFPTAPLVKPVLHLAEGGEPVAAVRAVQVLSRIGGKSVIPDLIRLLKSPDEDVAGAASAALESMTGVEIEFDPAQSPQARAKAIERWEAWWRENRHSVVLNK